jgi:cytochrome c oxidase assembly protein subunit 15
MAAAAVVGQIALGATVITEKLHAVLVTAHLGLGLILYSSLIFVVINTYYSNLKLKTSSLSSATEPAFGGKNSSVKYSSNKSTNL